MNSWWTYVLAPNVVIGIVCAFMTIYTDRKDVLGMRKMSAFEKCFFSLFSLVVCSVVWPLVIYEQLNRTIMRPACEKCKKERAIFSCSGTGDIPDYLKHAPHFICNECDKGGGCFMLKGEFIQ